MLGSVRVTVVPGAPYTGGTGGGGVVYLHVSLEEHVEDITHSHREGEEEEDDYREGPFREVTFTTCTSSSYSNITPETPSSELYVPV